MIVSGAALGALAVVAGAFGAHALDGALTSRERAWYDTAVTYHAIHALALLGCGLLGVCAAFADGGRRSRAAAATTLAACAFLAGVALFCGSLYLLSLGGPAGLGALAPLGGLALIVGWVALGIAALRLPRTVSSSA